MEHPEKSPARINPARTWHNPPQNQGKSLVYRFLLTISAIVSCNLEFWIDGSRNANYSQWHFGGLTTDLGG